LSPEQLLGELESNTDTIVVFDLEAGVGTLLRMDGGHADVVLVMCEPTTKSIEVAKRAAAIAETRAHVIVVANRSADDSDNLIIRDALPGRDVHVVPEDSVIARADREGRAAIDVDDDAPGIRAIIELAGRIEKMASTK
jgi:CO dehydrogenase maturation factor